VKSGDKFAVATFTCKENGKFVFPGEIEFSDDIEKINQKVDSIRYQRRSSKYTTKSQVYLALNEALQLYEQKNLEMPSGIVILSDDRNMDPDFAGETPVQRSRRLDIPVYCICLDKYDKTYEIEDLCVQTYGLYHPSNSVEDASKELQNILTGFIDRHEGLFYPFSYESTLEKDGKPHTIKIDSQEDQSAFVLTTPNKTLFEWMADNLILTIILAIVLIGLVVVLILLIKKNKLKKQELELRQKQQMEEMERQQSEAQMKLSSQEAEIRGIHEQERKQKEELERKRMSDQQQKEDEAQFAKMLERGNLPWFEFKVGDNSKIGANAVVLNEVEDNTTVVGVPGRPVKRDDERGIASFELDQIHIPDPVAQEFSKLRAKIEKLEKTDFKLQRRLLHRKLKQMQKHFFFSIPRKLRWP
jgi:hypothetical protein